MHDGSGVQLYAVKQADGTYALTSVTFTIEHSVTIKDAGGISTALVWVRESGSGSATSASIYAVSVNGGNGGAFGTVVTSVGKDGITGFVKLSGGTNLAKVTVNTASGEHTFNYSQNANQVWTKVN
jgi:hypothetical protein